MSTPVDDQAAGHTPLTADEREQLLPSYVVDRESLNAAEQANILQATRWLRQANPDVLSHGTLPAIHRRMFGDVWGWAGQFRATERNIGVAPHQIAEQLGQLVDNMRFQLTQRHPDWYAITARFHHQLVYIHPFPNGNGRWGRLATDQFLYFNGRRPPSWGRVMNLDAGDIRARYIDALRAGDRGDLSAMVAFFSESGDTFAII